jgi:carbonic anhydrase
MTKAIDKLISGYIRFRDHYSNPSQSLYKNLVEQGQKPIALIIGCCDSRVDPAIIMDCDPGDLFVVRNVANLVPPCEEDRHYHGTSAALEFGICVLNIPHIVILGHSHCGGIRSLTTENSHAHKELVFVSRWMDLVDLPSNHEMKQYFHLTPQQKEELYGKQSLISSLKNLQTFPWIQEKIERGDLELHAWYFNLTTGNIDEFDSETKEFQELSKRIS